MSNFVRDDIKVKSFAETLGFKAEVNHRGMWSEDVPNDPYSFVQCNHGIAPEFDYVTVWKTHKGWRVAKVSFTTPESGARFYDHSEFYDDAKDAIKLAYSKLPKNYAITFIEPNLTTSYLGFNDETFYFTRMEAEYTLTQLKKRSPHIEYTLVQQYEH